MGLHGQPARIAVRRKAAQQSGIAHLPRAHLYAVAFRHSAHRVLDVHMGKEGTDGLVAVRIGRFAQGVVQAIARVEDCAHTGRADGFDKPGQRRMVRGVDAGVRLQQQRFAALLQQAYGPLKIRRQRFGGQGPFLRREECKAADERAAQNVRRGAQAFQLGQLGFHSVRFRRAFVKRTGQAANGQTLGVQPAAPCAQRFSRKHVDGSVLHAA